jgi:hypothetical protein
MNEYENSILRVQQNQVGLSPFTPNDAPPLVVTMQPVPHFSTLRRLEKVSHTSSGLTEVFPGLSPSLGLSVLSSECSRQTPGFYITVTSRA